MNRLKATTHKKREVIDITEKVQAEMHRDHARENGRLSSACAVHDCRVDDGGS